MKIIPQIRLRTIFAIFVCVAVGLTVATATNSRGEFTDTILGVSTPQLNLPYAFLGAVLTAVIIGLLGQVRLLMRSSLQGGALSDGIRWARAFAVAWRLLLSAILVACLIVEILIARNVIALPPYDVYYLISELFPTLVWMLCLIVVVGVSVSRWTKKKVKRQRHALVTITMWLAGATFALVILPQPLLIQYLVHVATAGVERAIPAEFQRVGTFPDHQREGFRAFWMALAASVSIVVATASLIALNRRRSIGRWPRITLATSFLVALASAAAYSVWYYAAEFHRISPDLASAPLESEWRHWLAGGMFLVIAVTIGAYRLTCRDEEYTLLENQREGQQGPIALYETAGCLLLERVWKVISPRRSPVRLA